MNKKFFFVLSKRQARWLYRLLGLMPFDIARQMHQALGAILNTSSPAVKTVRLGDRRNGHHK